MERALTSLQPVAKRIYSVSDDHKSERDDVPGVWHFPPVTETVVEAAPHVLPAPKIDPNNEKVRVSSRENSATSA